MAFKPSALQNLALFIIRQKPGIKRVALAKLIYLVDWEHFKTTGKLLTGATYVRADKGPLAFGLDNEIKAMDGWEITVSGNKEKGYTHSPLNTARFEPGFSPYVSTLVDSVLKKYSQYSWMTLVKVSYETTPMQVVFALEGKGQTMKNKRMNLDALCRQDPLWEYQERARRLSFQQAGTDEERMKEEKEVFESTALLRKRATTLELRKAEG
jgi:uncharacterized phage-associated protein